jgi:hypothetical protein
VAAEESHSHYFLSTFVSFWRHVFGTKTQDYEGAEQKSKVSLHLCFLQSLIPRGTLMISSYPKPQCVCKDSLSQVSDTSVKIKKSL